MKAIFAVLLALGVAGAPAVARTSTSPLLGSWAVDVSRLPMPPAARPKNVTFTFSDAGGGKWKTDVDIRGGDGSDRHMISTYAPDGSAAPIEGDQSEADTSAVKLPAPNVMVMALAKSGEGTSTRIYTVAPDGKTMVETAVYFGRDGKPIMRTNYFNRIR
jgi:hypothetical protein